jgi:hypothetical protein
LYDGKLFFADRYGDRPVADDGFNELHAFSSNPAEPRSPLPGDRGFSDQIFVAERAESRSQALKADYSGSRPNLEGTPGADGEARRRPK